MSEENIKTQQPPEPNAAGQDPEQTPDKERLHQEQRAKRIARMKKEKQRQAQLRKKIKLCAGIGAGCLCIIGLIVACFVSQKNSDAAAGRDVVSADRKAGLMSGMPEDNSDEAGPAGSAGSDGEGSEASDEDREQGGSLAAPETGTDSANTDSDNTDGDNTVSVNEDSDNTGNDNPAAEQNGGGLFFDGYSAKIDDDTPYIASEDVISSYAILLDLDTGEVVAQKDARTVISPASMTKILTLLVAAEHITDPDDTFTMTLDITDYAYVNDCSTAGFLENETVTVRDLMYGTILPSGGEAAAALAVYTAGSLDAFVDMMNDKLEELGLSGTAHFTNCVGLYDEDHHCSVYDMAMILKAAAENETCREVLSAHTYTTSATEQHPEGIILSNWFLRRIEDKDTHGEVICAKTGFVDQSGNCGASYAISNSGGHYICVTGNAWSSWRCIYDHVAIYQEYTD